MCMFLLEVDRVEMPTLKFAQGGKAPSRFWSSASARHF
jgi:hypothetical protein